MDIQTCVRCGKDKDFANFVFAAVGGKKNGRPTTVCKQCQSNDRYVKKYGITLDDYENLLREQDGKCKICGKPETVINLGKVKKLSVDHNHTTGQVRSLLCYTCNTCLGLAKDNPNTLLAMADYLIRWERAEAK